MTSYSPSNVHRPAVEAKLPEFDLSDEFVDAANALEFPSRREFLLRPSSLPTRAPSSVSRRSPTPTVLETTGPTTWTLGTTACWAQVRTGKIRTRCAK